MSDSFIGCSDDLVIIEPRYSDSRILSVDFNHRALKAAVPFLLMIFAVFLAPETPQELASICERHNPEIVCKVW